MSGFVADEDKDSNFVCSDSKVSPLYLKGTRIRMTSTKEVRKMSWIDLFGLVGGYLGLFVGVSTLTIFEVVEFFLTLCYEKVDSNFSTQLSFIKMIIMKTLRHTEFFSKSLKSRSTFASSHAKTIKTFRLDT